MPKIEIPFATYEGQSEVRQNSAETLINMFAEVEISGRKKLTRRQRAGVELVYAVTGEKRCIERFKTLHYAVIGEKFYSFDGTTLDELGGLDSSTGRCTMIFDDNDEVMISDGENAYHYDGSTLSVVTIPDDKPVGTLAYQGGFGIFNIDGEGQFYITGLNDFSSVDPLDFATAESYPDPIVRVFVAHNELWLFGSRSVEVWQLSGGTDFPYSPFSNAQMERGCAAAFSVAADDNTVFWLGDDYVVYRAEGYRPLRISTHPVERLIENVSASGKSAAEAFFYTMGGHKFYTLRFPGELTLQYNIATGFWNVAQTFGLDDWHIIGSAGHNTSYQMTPGGIVQLVSGLNKDEGGIMRRGGRSAPLDADGARIGINSFWLDAEVGRAAINNNANVMMRVARDGETFGNERVRSLGATGQYRRRAIWRGLGQGRRPVIELFVTDDVEFSIVSTHADLEVWQ